MITFGNNPFTSKIVIAHVKCSFCMTHFYKGYLWNVFFLFVLIQGCTDFLFFITSIMSSIIGFNIATYYYFSLFSILAQQCSMCTFSCLYFNSGNQVAICCLVSKRKHKPQSKLFQELFVTFQKHLVRDNKETLTASKLRCRSLQEALEGCMFVYI